MISRRSKRTGEHSGKSQASRRALAILMSFAMVLSSVPTSAIAEGLGIGDEYAEQVAQAPEQVADPAAQDPAAPPEELAGDDASGSDAAEPVEAQASEPGPEPEPVPAEGEPAPGQSQEGTQASPDGTEGGQPAAEPQSQDGNSVAEPEPAAVPAEAEPAPEQPKEEGAAPEQQAAADDTASEQTPEAGQPASDESEAGKAAAGQPVSDQQEAEPATELPSAKSDSTAEAAPAATPADATQPAEKAAEAPAPEPAYPAIDHSQELSVAGTTLTVRATAPEGAYPEGTTVEIASVASLADQAIAATAAGRAEDREVAAAYVFEVRLRAADGTELAYDAEHPLSVSVKTASIADDELDVQAFALTNINGSIAATRYAGGVRHDGDTLSFVTDTTLHAVILTREVAKQEEEALEQAEPSEDEKAAADDAEKARQDEGKKAATDEAETAKPSDDDEATSSKAETKDDDKAATSNAEAVKPDETEKDEPSEDDKAATGDADAAKPAEAKQANPSEDEAAKPSDTEKAATGETEKATSDEEDKAATNDIEKAATDETEKKPETSAPEQAMPAFEQSQTVDGVTVTVQAEEGTFPQGATLQVRSVPTWTEAIANAKVDQVRDSSREVATSYTFDITVLDASGAEAQPADGKKVNVAFNTREVADEKLSTEVFHIDSATGEPEQLEVAAEAETATVEVDGFSIYVVTFASDETTVQTIGGTNGTVVTYKFVNGSTEVQSQDVKAGDKLYEPSVPVAPTGQRFTGWWIGSELLEFDENGTTTISALHADTNGVVTVTAGYEAYHYVTFYNQDGNVHSRIGVVDNGSIASTDVPTYTPKRASQTFLGWSATENSGTADVSFPISNITTDASYYPAISEKYVVHFDANRGSASGMAEDADNGIPGVNVSYTAPVLVEPGQAATRPADPHAELSSVYTFNGWYTEPSCANPYDWSQPVTGNLTLYAGWNVGTTSYQVVVMKEKSSILYDDASRNSLTPGNYEFFESYTVDSAAVLSNVTVPSDSPALSPEHGFELPSYGTPSAKTVLPDGSTTFYVYWNREVRSVSFYLLTDKVGSGTLNSAKYRTKTLDRTYTGLYGQNFDLYEDRGYVWPTNRRWYAGFRQDSNNYYSPCYNTTLGAVSLRGSFNDNLYPEYYAGTDSSQDCNCYDILQQPDGSWVKSESIARKVSSAGITAHDLFQNFKVSAYSVGYKEKENQRTPVSENGDIAGSTSDRYVYHSRQEFIVTFYKDATTVLKTQPVRWEDTLPIAVPTITPDDPMLSFKGWSTTYGDTDPSHDFDFNNFTMPDYNIRLYPILVTDAIKVVLDKSGDDVVMAGGTEFWPMAGAPIDMTNMNDATRPGYELDGWYTQDNTPWDEGYGADIQYCDKVGGDYVTYPDPSYGNKVYTITLTAKWTKSEDAPVSYVLGEGTGSVSDSAIYVFNGRIKVSETAPTPPTGKIFVGWKDRTGAVHLPGETFEFDTNDLVLTEGGVNSIPLTALYINEGVPKATITYNANYPAGATNTGATSDSQGPLDFNARVQLKGIDAFSAEGYMLDGWGNTAGAKDYDLDADVLVDNVVNGSNDNTLYGHWTTHTHHWVYTLNGSTITATCDTPGHAGDPLNVTLAAPSATTYSGSAIVATVTEDEGFPMPTGNSAAITYTKDEQSFTGTPKEVGTYTASVTIDGKTASVTYTITKNEANAFNDGVEAVPTLEGWEYDGTSHTPTGPNGNKFGDIRYVYSTSAEGTYTSDAPTDAGAYYVKAVVDGTDNYNGIESKPTAFTISPKELKAGDIEWSNSSLTYTGSEQQVTATIKSGLVGTDAITLTMAGNKATDAGTYSATASLPNDITNYVLSDEASAAHEWTIGKKPAPEESGFTATEAKPSADDNLTYAGGPVALLTAPSSVPEGYEIRYSLEENGEYTKEIPTGDGTGPYTVYYKYVADDNHADVNYSYSIQANIKKATIKVTAKDQTITYGEAISSAENSYTIEGVKGENDKATVTLTPSTASATGDTPGSITPTVTVKRGDADVTSNYDVEPTNGKLVINVAQYEGSAPTDANGLPIAESGLVYTGSDQALVSSLQSDDDGHVFAEYTSVLYSLDGENWLPAGTLPTGKNAGEGDSAYKVHVKYTGDPNHSDYILSEPLTVAIAQKEVGLTWSAESLEYSGLPQAPQATATGVVGGDAVNVTVTGQQTNVGTGYTATASALDNANYKLPDNATKTFSIVKNDDTGNESLKSNQKPTGKPSTGDGSLTYNGETQELVVGPKEDGETPALPDGYVSITYKVYKGEELVGTFEGGALPTAVNAGTYTVKVTYVGDANHADFDGDDISVTIGQKELTSAMLSVTNNHTEYSGSAIAPVLAVSDKSGEKELITEGDYTVSGNDSKTNVKMKDGAVDPAGYAITVTAAPNGNYKGSATVHWNLSQAAAPSKSDLEALPAESKPTDASPIYNGASQNLVINPTAEKMPAGYNKVEYLSKDASGNDVWSTSIPQGTNAVDSPYTVTYRYADSTGNHATTDSLTTTATIQKLDISGASITLDPASFVYDATEHKPAVASAAKDGVPIDVASLSATHTNNVNVGTGTTTVIANENSNFTGTASASFSITPATVTNEPDAPAGPGKYKIAIEPIASAVYNGEAQVPTVVVKLIPSVETAEGTWDWETDEEKYVTLVQGDSASTGDYAVTYKKGDSSISSDKLVDAGTYTAVVTLSNNYNNNAFEAGYVINPKALAAGGVTLDPTSFVYDPDKESQIPTITVTATLKDGATATQLQSGRDYTYAIKDSSGNVVGSPKNIGTYTVEVSGKGNYATGPVSKAYTIVKSQLDPSSMPANSQPTLVAQGLTYTGKSQSLVSPVPSENVPAGYKLQYKLESDGDDKWSDSVPQGKDVATYSVVYKYVPVDPNYAEVSDPSFKLAPTIAKADLTKAVVSLNPNSEVFDGNDKAPAVTVTLESGDVLDPSEYTVSVKKGDVTVDKPNQAAGYTYTVTAASNNVAGSKETSYSVTSKPLAQDDVTITFPDDYKNPVYNGTPQKPAPIVVVSGKTLVAGTDYDIVYPNETTNAGSKTAKVVFKGDYMNATETDAVTTKDVTFAYTIDKAPLTIKAKDQTLSHNGSIATGVSQVTAVGLVSNEEEGVSDTLTSIALAQSTTKEGSIGTIKVSDAVVKNASGQDVTDNYAITFDNSGKLTIKASQSQPGEGDVENLVDSQATKSITINVQKGYEYVLTTSADVPADSDWTVDWSTISTAGDNGYYKADENGTYKFTGLEEGTAYFVHARKAAVDPDPTATPEAPGKDPSPAVTVPTSTQPNAPDANAAATIDYVNETVTATSGNEAKKSTDGEDAYTSSAVPFDPGDEIDVRVAASKDEGGADIAPSEATTIKTANRPGAPAAVVESTDADNQVSKSDTTITIQPTTAGQQYIVVPKGTVPSKADWLDSTKTQTSTADGQALTFTGLSPDTEYDVYTRTVAVPPAEGVTPKFASENSEPTTVKTKSSTTDMGEDEKAAIEGGTWDKDTADPEKIVVNGQDGYEYLVLPKGTPAENVDWSKGAKCPDAFEGSDGKYTKEFTQDSNGRDITPDGDYEILVRKSETDDAMPSEPVTVEAYTTKPAPTNAHDGYAVDYPGEKVSAKEGYEIRLVKEGQTANAGWTSGPIAATPGAKYEVRLKEAKDGDGNVTAHESAPAAFTLSERPVAAAGDKVEATDTTLTVDPTAAGQQYMVVPKDKDPSTLTDADWAKGTVQTSSAGEALTFDRLLDGDPLRADTEYVVVTRVPAKANDGKTEGAFKSEPVSSPAQTRRSEPGSDVTDGLVTDQTKDSITIKTQPGYEYVLTTSSEPPADEAAWSAAGTTSTPKLNDGYYEEKGTVPGTHTFEGLEPGKKYYVHVRAVATTDPAKEPSMPTSVPTSTRLDDITPAEGTSHTFDYVDETVSAETAPAPGYLIRPKGAGDGAWTKGPLPFTPGQEFEVKKVGTHDEDGNELIADSAPATITAPTRPEAPRPAPKATPVNDKSVMVNPSDAAQEYIVLPAKEGGYTDAEIQQFFESANPQVSGKDDGSYLVIRNTADGKPLVAGTGYVVYSRTKAVEPVEVDATVKPAIASKPAGPANVKTKTSTAPMTPDEQKAVADGTWDDSTANPTSIVVNGKDGYEYLVIPKSQADAVDFTPDWAKADKCPDKFLQGKRVYTKDSNGDKVTADTDYAILVRKSETGDAMPSQPARVDAYTTQPAPKPGEGHSDDVTLETITVEEGYEIIATSPKGTQPSTWKQGEAVIPMTPGATYQIRKVQEKDADGNVTKHESAPTEFGIPGRPAAPHPASDAVDVNHDDETITAKDQPAPGYEIQDPETGKWVKGPIPAEPGKTYPVRVAPDVENGVPASEPADYTAPERDKAPDAVDGGDISQTDTTITVDPTTKGQQYIVLPTKADGKPYAPEELQKAFEAAEKAGTAKDGTGGPVTFGKDANGKPLQPGKDYQVYNRAAAVPDGANPKVASKPAGPADTYTKEPAPKPGEGYKPNYPDETIAVEDGYEIVVTSPKGTEPSTWTPGPAVVPLTPGATYQVRRKADPSAKPPVHESMPTEFTAAERPETPAPVDGRSVGSTDRTITVSPTDKAQDYVVLPVRRDGKGNVVPYTDEEIAKAMGRAKPGNGGALEFDTDGNGKPIEAGTEYVVASRVRATGSAPASRPAQSEPIQTRHSTPAAPKVSADTTSVTVSPTSAEQEYSIDGGKTWVAPEVGADGKPKDVVFDGLLPGQEYEVVARTKATDTGKASEPSEPARVTTPRDQSSEAEKPAAGSTPTRITLSETVPGQEYIILPKGATPTESDWLSAARPGADGSVSFDRDARGDGLVPGAEYTVYTRVPGDDTHEPGEPTSISVKTPRGAGADVMDGVNAEGGVAPMTDDRGSFVTKDGRRVRKGEDGRYYYADEDGRIAEGARPLARNADGTLSDGDAKVEFRPAVMLVGTNPDAADNVKGRLGSLPEDDESVRVELPLYDAQEHAPSAYDNAVLDRAGVPRGLVKGRDFDVAYYRPEDIDPATGLPREGAEPLNVTDPDAADYAFDAGETVAVVKFKGDYAGTVSVPVKIGRREFHVVTPSAEKQFDGFPLTAPDRTLYYVDRDGNRVQDSLIGGQTVEVSVTGSLTRPGSGRNGFTLRFKGEAEGTPSDELAAQATDLSAQAYGEVAAADAEPAAQGAWDAVLSALGPRRAYADGSDGLATDGNPTAKRKNYVAIDESGTLTVTGIDVSGQVGPVGSGRRIAIVAAPDPANEGLADPKAVRGGDSATYTGRPIQGPALYDTDDKDEDGNPRLLVEGTDYDVAYYELNEDGTPNYDRPVTDPTDAGAYAMVVTFKGRYSGEHAGTVTIDPAGLTVTTPSATKAYDGKALAASDGARLDGLVAGETATLRVTGSQTEVGSSRNGYAIAWDGSAKERNYRVAREELGTLKVTAAPTKTTPAPAPAATTTRTATATRTASSLPNTGDERGLLAGLRALAAVAVAAMTGGLLLRRRDDEEDC